MDVSQYLEIFIDESNEHLQNLSDGIMILEKEPDNSDTINEIFRAAHSLKGMAGTMGYKRMQNLTHDMENVFSEVRNGNIKVDSRMVDVLFQCLDALEQYVNNIQETSDEGTDDNEPIIKALNSFIVNNEDKGVLPEEANKEEAPAEEKKEESTDVAGTYARYNNMVFADFEKNPDLIILDEPINALDEAGAKQVHEILEEQKKRGALIIIACHDKEELEMLSDEIIEISEGRIIEK